MSDDRLSIGVTVPGPPVGAARPRVVRLKTGASHTYMPDRSVRWEETARWLLSQRWSGPAYDGLVGVSVRVWHRRPKRLRRKKDPRVAVRAGRKPDLDNVAKLALDAIVKAGIIPDDTRVAELHAERWYLPLDDSGAQLGTECVEITIRALGDR